MTTLAIAQPEMGPLQLVSAILLILSCILIIVIVFFQGAQKGGMSQSITGQSSDNYYQRNMGRSKEMKLKKATTALAVLFFSVAIAVNVIAAHFSDDGGNTPTPNPTPHEHSTDCATDDFVTDEPPPTEED